MKIFRVMRGHQSGYTLLEVIASVVVMALLGLGAAAVSRQMMIQGPRDNNNSVATQNLDNAFATIDRDAAMAQTITPATGGKFPLTLSWTTWSCTVCQVVYSLQGGALLRQYSENGAVVSTATIAANINSNADLTNCAYTGGVLTMKLSASVGSGASAVTLTNTYEISPRPGL